MSDNAPPITPISLDAIRTWLIATTRLFARFAAILIVLAGALIASFLLHLPLIVSYGLILSISAVLFIMLIMMSIKNIVYLYLKSSVWGQIVLYLLVALISARSYLWAIGAINRIFLVDPSNLALTTTVLTAIVFFRYAVMILLATYLLAIGLYFYVRQKDGAQNSDRQKLATKILAKKLYAGAAFVVIVGLSVIAAGNISKYSDQMIQAFAIHIDFYTHHACINDDKGMKDSDGILFLSARDILVAKKAGPMQWQYQHVRCQTP
ncbi:hypothetical protein AAIR29_05825 [Psychrobacter sp. FBL11]|uniref:Uncharacterized protein n=1 Tax=Psychrobacter saeujeotis TaxID=3143436 RepID=A0ABU9X6X3_9GAMM|nr:hypothetical protein [uncultured Psychrobacter sp.]